MTGPEERVPLRMPPGMVLEVPLEYRDGEPHDVFRFSVDHGDMEVETRRIWISLVSFVLQGAAHDYFRENDELALKILHGTDDLVEEYFSQSVWELRVVLSIDPDSEMKDPLDERFAIGGVTVDIKSSQHDIGTASALVLFAMANADYH